MTDQRGELPSAIAIDPDELQLHKLYRERIVQEDNLINHRMTWFFASQSFLMLAWAALYKISSGPTPPPVSLIVDITGIVFAASSRKAINAAHSEIMSLNKKYKSIYRRFNPNDDKEPDNPKGVIPERNLLIPDLIGGGTRHNKGHIVTRRMPIALGFVWFIAIAFLVADQFNATALLKRLLHIN